MSPFMSESELSGDGIAIGQSVELRSWEGMVIYVTGLKFRRQRRTLLLSSFFLTFTLLRAPFFQSMVVSLPR